MGPPPEFSRLLTDPSITDVLVNGPFRIYADRGDGLELTEAKFPGALELRAWAQAELTKVGKSWDAKHPFIDARFESGHRAQITFPPVTGEALLVSLRKLPAPSAGDAKAEARARWGNGAFERLVSASAQGENMLVAGATGSGKTTLVNDLLAFVPEKERILALEDTPELRPAHPHFLSLLSRTANADGFGEVTLRDLLRQSLRMRPDRILLGECRGGEVLELLQALNTGHRGTIATLHANSPRDAIRRIELLCLLGAHGQLPIPVARELISGGIRWIAFVGRDAQGKRKILELSSLEGREGDTLLLRAHPV